VEKLDPIPWGDGSFVHPISRGDGSFIHGPDLIYVMIQVSSPLNVTLRCHRWYFIYIG